MAKAVLRKNYLRGAKTIPYAAGGTDNIVLSGQFNQVNFSLRGPSTTGGAGAVVGKGILEMLPRMQITSTKHGTVADFDASDLYYISRVFYGSAALTALVIAAGPSANIGFEAALPLSCDHDESLTITVTWGALVSGWSDLTVYGGVLRVNAEVLPHNPENKWAWRKQIVGANGVIAANTQHSQPTIPNIGPGFDLACAVIQTNTTAKGTYTDALDSITLQQGVGNYIIDDNAALLKHTFNILVPVANIDGVYPLKWYPFDHTAETQLNLTAGAVATVIGSQVVFGFSMRLAQKMDYGGEPGLQPQEPPTAPAIQAPIAAEPHPASASQRFGGMFAVPPRPVERAIQYRK